MTKREKWDNALSFLQFIGFAIVIASLPLSNFFMSFGSFWIVGAWLLQVITDIVRKEDWKQRFIRYVNNKSALLLTGLYALPLIGLLWTDDFKYAAWDLRMKLPILFLPFVLVTINPLSYRAYRALIGIFLSSLLFAIFWCLLIYWGIRPKPFTDVREISVFISHIRFSLLLVLGMCISFYETWNTKAGKLFSLFFSLFVLYFLIVIGSITGFLVLTAIMGWWVISSLFKSKGKTKWISLGLLIVVPLVVFTWLYRTSTAYYDVQPINWSELEQHSPRGEAYEHNAHYPLVEQGHYVYSHVAPQELAEAWLERTGISIDSTDARGQRIRETLIRYMASKGLYKDYDSVYQLTGNDIKAVLAGHVDHDEIHMNALELRIDDILFEYSSYSIDGNPSGHSVFQRFEFWKAAWGIIKGQPWMGVGTGDVKQAFVDQYIAMDTKLEESYRLRAHNQYLTMWLTYGILGLLYFLLLVFYPLIGEAKGDKLFMAFTIIAAMSFLTEDTLETQAGVMFFAFFYSFLLIRKFIKEPQPVQER
jgi:hypothetical protein